jgi:hypothetical protein
MSGRTRAQFVSRPLLIRDGRRGQSRIRNSFGVPLPLLLGVTAVRASGGVRHVANLLLARSVRATEMAVRVSLGTSRRHVLSESCVLAILGGAVALVVAQWTLCTLGALLPPEVADGRRVTLDPYAVPFAGAVSFMTGALFGIFQALHGKRFRVDALLRNRQRSAPLWPS